MARIPITVEKIKARNKQSNTYRTEFLITIHGGDKKWKNVHRCSLKELTAFKEEIDLYIDSSSTAEKLNISEEKGIELDKAYEKDDLCRNCEFRLSQRCVTCLFILQSPLERKLFLALSKEKIYASTQYALNWHGENISTVGKSYDNPQNNFKDVLTIADFFIENKGVKLCIYTDGHSYHERTEEQAQRDRRIDRKLQELGYQTLRFTGKDINEDMDKVIKDIKKWL